MARAITEARQGRRGWRRISGGASQFRWIRQQIDAGRFGSSSTLR
jgi:hypothetical protein